MAIRLGYDTYSIRALNMDAFQHLEYAAAQKLDAIQFSGLESFRSFDPAYLTKVKQRASELRLHVDGGTGCICELSKSWDPKNGSPVTMLNRGLEITHAIGAKVMRCYMGTQLDRFGDRPLAQLMEATVSSFKAVRSKALDLEVKIAIENHKDLQAWQVRELILASGKDFVGSNLDLGNPLTLMEHPLTTLETLAPYTLTSHVRDTAVYEVPEGAAVQWTALGDGSVDFKPIVEQFQKLCPNSSLHLEIITGRPPQTLPYLQRSFWKTFDGMPAADFARFVALAKQGRPFRGFMVVEDGAKSSPEFQAAMNFQQRDDLERSFKYAKEVLGLGLS